MPLKAVDYSKTLIYKLEHNVDKSLVYVGSTTDFKTRKSAHKRCCNSNSKKCNMKVYKMILENGGWDSFQMLEIKKYPCKDSNEARAEEERCRVELQANMNTNKAHSGTESIKQYNKQYYQEHTEFHKLYYQEHTDELCKYRKQYYQEHADEIHEHNKQYYQQHADELREKSKQYYQEHADKIREKKKQYYLTKKSKL